MIYQCIRWSIMTYNTLPMTKKSPRYLAEQGKSVSGEGLNMMRKSREIPYSRESRLLRRRLISTVIIENGQSGHWREDENQKYTVFLYAHRRDFQRKSLRRSQKIFKAMSRFVLTRSADQCRSHHQKMQKKCHTFQGIVAYLSRMHLMDSSTFECLLQKCRRLEQAAFRDSSASQEEIEPNDVKSQPIPTHDMSQFFENGYYVMPSSIIACSETTFYAIWGPAIDSSNNLIEGPCLSD